MATTLGLAIIRVITSKVAYRNRRPCRSRRNTLLCRPIRHEHNVLWPLSVTKPMTPTNPEDVKLQIDGLVQIAKWISALIMSGAGLAACVCVLRLLKQTDFTIGQLKLSLSQFPYVILAFTGAHFFLMWIFVQKVAATRNSGVEVAHRAWLAVTSSEAFVFFNMQPRVWHLDGGPLRSGAFVAASTDTAYWATFAFVIVIIAAVVASRLPSVSQPINTRRIFSQLAFACSLALANWIIGSRWATAASSLLL